MKKTIVAALLGATLLGGGALAATQDAPRGRGMGGMLRADANGDGVVTRDEVLASVDARFARLDTNKDGKIDAAEREAARAAMGGRGPGGPGGPGGMRVRGDVNGDGVVTVAEERAQAIAMFDRMDTNHDGKIDAAERDAAREAMRAMRGMRGDMPAPPPPPAGAPASPTGN